MSPVIDEEIEEEDDLLTEVFFCIQFILYLLLNKGILTESAFFSQMRKSVQQKDSLQVICKGQTVNP